MKKPDGKSDEKSYENRMVWPHLYISPVRATQQTSLNLILTTKVRVFLPKEEINIHNIYVSMLTNTTSRITCDQVIKAASRITESGPSPISSTSGRWHLSGVTMRYGCIGWSFIGDYPLSCWEIIYTSREFNTTHRTSQVVLTRRGDDEPVVKTTHGGRLSDVINPQCICCDLRVSFSYYFV